MCIMVKLYRHIMCIKSVMLWVVRNLTFLCLDPPFPVSRVPVPLLVIAAFTALIAAEDIEWQGTDTLDLTK